MREVFYPGGKKRITHLCIAAHQDDTEFMAYSPIAACYRKKNLCFGSVIVTDGAGSPRSGAYAAYSDEQMKKVRVGEQKEAARLGGYGVQYLLDYSSAQVKDGEDEKIETELACILREEKPKLVYTHNLADKHITHAGVAVKTIRALRRLPDGELPEKVYGCEVWRDLDWLCDEEKIILDCGDDLEFSRALSGTFQSQIAGGKRYDLACEGRRFANATFSQSHACDRYTMINYAMDLTPLVKDKSLDIADYVAGCIERFSACVRSALDRLTR